MGMTVTIDENFHAQKHYVMGQLSEIRDNLEAELQIELQNVLERIKADAVSLCPKDTGALASSISIDDSGKVDVSDFYGNTISAGRDDIVNPKTGKSTASYACFVHDGHLLPNGEFWEGEPFLDEAMLLHIEELEKIVDRVLKNIGEAEPSAGTVAEQENVK